MLIVDVGDAIGNSDFANELGTISPGDSSRVKEL